MKFSKKHNAFTLTELMVVIVILVILMAIIIPRMIGVDHKKHILNCQANLKKLSNAFHLYLLDNDNYAPFNPAAGERSPANSFGASDCFYSWEVLYLLAPYLGDPDRKKFYNGKLNVGRCPGNKCRLYTYGDDPIGGKTTPAYKTYFSNRQAPKKWSDVFSIVKSEDRYNSINICDPDIYPQLMDYQYNNTLGGVFVIYGVGMATHRWFTTHGNKRSYKTDFIVKRPSEAVVFCDMQYANVHPYITGSDTEKDTDSLVYVYNLGADQWAKNDKSILPFSLQTQPYYYAAKTYKYIRTNETIHNGTGINAVFFDGHAEFIPAEEVYNFDVNLANDILNWGVSYPEVTDPVDNSKYIPGVKGVIRGKPKNYEIQAYG